MKFLSLFPILFLLNSCASTNSNALTCCDMIDKYNDSERLQSISIDVAKGFKRTGIQIYKDNLSYAFQKMQNEYIDSLYSNETKIIENYRIHDYCFNLNNIIKDTNTSELPNKLKEFEASWQKRYKDKVDSNISVDKFKFNEIDGCDETALRMNELNNDRAGRRRESEHLYQNIKILYFECLRQMKPKEISSEANITTTPKVDAIIMSEDDEF